MSTQEQVFKRDVEPLLDDVFKGLTVTVFAYGVTSSGKTHTMQGSKEEPGIIPRVISVGVDLSQLSPKLIRLSTQGPLHQVRRISSVQNLVSMVIYGDLQGRML